MNERMDRPRFLTLDEVVLYHALSIEEFGGSAGLRDLALLQSAVAQAEIGFEGKYLHRFPFEMAAAYGFHLARNHPFEDGNKRVAWTAVRAFLFRNGFILRINSAEAAGVIVAVAAGRMKKSDFAQWLEQHAQQCEPPTQS